MNAPLTVHAYSAQTGNHLGRLPYVACSWSDSISEPGQMQVDVTMGSTMAVSSQGASLYEMLRPWKTLLAVQRTPSDVKHAGVITSRQWDPASRKLSLSVGGGWTLLGKRLVLDHALDDAFHDGDVLVDEEHPAGHWAMTFTGSYRDIAAGLVSEALKWGSLPITLPGKQGGDHTRTYYGWDLATVADRLSDLADLQDGDEIRFRPTVDMAGRLSFALEATPDLADRHWQWTASVPGQRVRLTGYQEDGSGMRSDVWAMGGKSSDKTVMARATRNDLPSHGWPVLQTKNSEHTTVSELATLKHYATAQAWYGTGMNETIGLSVGEEYPVHVGDWADVRVEDDFLGDRVLHLKITDVKGSSDSDWLDLQARTRTEG